MSLRTQMDTISAEILSILEDMTSLTFTVTKEGRFQPVDNFPAAFFWAEGELPLGNDYLDGDLIRQVYFVAGYDFNIALYDTYDDAEKESRGIAADLRDEFSKQANQTLSESVFQSQVVKMIIDPGLNPFQMGGGLMASGGIQLLVTYRQNRGS